MGKASQNMKERLLDLGEALKYPPSSFDELYSLLDVTDGLLARVEQSPSQLILDALPPLMKALVVKDFVRHSDMDVKVSVASCLNEITRITAPELPYEDDIMKEVFQMIVGVFEGLYDMYSRSYQKRVSILETVAKVRSCVVMLDLECDALILQMFQHFLKTIRVEHSENVFSSMETIMTLVINKSEDISSELLSCLLDTMKNDNKDVLPIAAKLAEKVMTGCARKIKPYMSKLIQSAGASLSEYSKVVASICQENSDGLDPNETLAFGEAVEMASSPRSASKTPNADEVHLGYSVRPKSRRKRALETKKEVEERLVGSMIKVWWAEDKMFHECVVESYDRHTKKHTLVYTDRGMEPLVLKNELWESVENALEKDKAMSSSSRSASRSPNADEANLVDSVRAKSWRKCALVTKKEMALSPISASKAPNADDANLGDSVRPKSRRKRASETKKEVEERLVGSMIKVWWPKDKMFYECIVQSYDCHTKEHELVYTDGDVEHLVLKDERWESVENVLESDKGKEDGTASGGILPQREIEGHAEHIGTEALDYMLEEAGRTAGIPGLESEGFTRALQHVSQGQAELCRYYHSLRLSRDRVKSLEENVKSLSELVRLQGAELEEERTRLRRAEEEGEELKKKAGQVARAHRNEMWKAKARADVLFEAGVKYVKKTFLELHPGHVDLLSFLENTAPDVVGTSAETDAGLDM